MWFCCDPEPDMKEMKILDRHIYGNGLGRVILITLVLSSNIIKCSSIFAQNTNIISCKLVGM